MDLEDVANKNGLTLQTNINKIEIMLGPKEKELKQFKRLLS